MLHYCPFMFDAQEISRSNPDYFARQDFVSIGNFRHAPNWDSFVWLTEMIWPKIRAKLPASTLHLYGSYAPPKATRLHQPNHGIVMHGRATDALDVQKTARICLAPLRFGAGLKGKLVDAMLAGTPSVTTPVGAEGMHANLHWPGSLVPCSDAFDHADATHFADAAIALYDDAEQWQQAQTQGYCVLQECFDGHQHGNALIERLHQLFHHREHHRLYNFTGAMLRHHQHRSTEFMSRWIEAKHASS